MDSKTIAWLSYITIIGWIVAYVNHSNSVVKSSLATFHLRQSFGLMVVYFAIWIINIMLMFIIPFLSTVIWLLYIVVIVFWVIGLVNAINGEEKPLPAVGLQFQQWFRFIK
jgi:uncharacterized membrane protein